MTEIEKAYFAGLVDGEGCINMRTSHNNGKYPSIAASLHIAMTDIEPIAYVMQICGNIGSLSTDKSIRYKQRGWQPMNHWVLSTQQAEI
jgi:hypothetical protein